MLTPKKKVCTWTEYLFYTYISKLHVYANLVLKGTKMYSATLWFTSNRNDQNIVLHVNNILVKSESS